MSFEFFCVTLVSHTLEIQAILTFIQSKNLLVGPQIKHFCSKFLLKINNGLRYPIIQLNSQCDIFRIEIRISLRTYVTPMEAITQQTNTKHIQLNTLYIHTQSHPKTQESRLN